MVHGIAIPAAADQPLQEGDFRRLQDYQAAVYGWIEPIDLPDIGATVYVNADGLLRQLPFNSRITFLWWFHVPAARRSRMLVGNAVIVGTPDRNGESTDIPEELSNLLMTPGVFRVEVRKVGDPRWHGNAARHDDYFEALVWAMLTLEQVAEAGDVRVTPVDAGPLTDPAA